MWTCLLGEDIWGVGVAGEGAFNAACVRTGRLEQWVVRTVVAAVGPVLGRGSAPPASRPPHPGVGALKCWPGAQGDLGVPGDLSGHWEEDLGLAPPQAKNTKHLRQEVAAAALVQDIRILGGLNWLGLLDWEKAGT